MVSLAVCLAMARTMDAKSTLEAVRKHYEALTTFSMVIEHKDSSGLFPGSYSGELKWRKGGHFQLTVTRPSDFVASESKPGMKAPDFYADGRNVVAVGAAGIRSTKPLAEEEVTMPGWEVAGTLVLSWLEGTANGKLVTNPVEGFKVEYSDGSRTEWQKTKVKELILTVKFGGEKQDASLFVSEDGHQLVGMEWKVGTKVGYYWCLNQKENPKLPANIGEVPK